MMMRWAAVAALLRVATPQCGSYASVTVVGRAPRAGVPLAEGCKYVYLDFGGHHGVQARKIFEQRRYATTNPKKMVMYRSAATSAAPSGARTASSSGDSSAPASWTAPASAPASAA